VCTPPGVRPRWISSLDIKIAILISSTPMGRNSKVAKKSGAGAKSGRIAKSGTKYRLTVSAGKLAVLLRLPKSTIKIIDEMAAETKTRRTTVLYGIIGDHPLLIESMKDLLVSEQSR
jgi:hypothetical protein